MKFLNIEERSIFRNPKDIRRNNFVPGVFYGPNVDVTPVKAQRQDLLRKYNGLGEILWVESRGRKVMVKVDELQRDPVSNDPLHFSLVELPMGEETKVDIPVKLNGIPKGVKDGGSLMVLKEELAVSGLPKKIPAFVSKNVRKMKIGDKLTIEGLNINNNLEVLDDESEVVAICVPPIKDEAIIESPSGEIEVVTHKDSNEENERPARVI